MNRPSLLIIPTYNEAANIQTLIGRIRSLSLPLEILVVDDNSPDGTGVLVRDLAKNNLGLHLLSRQNKDGLASAYIAGFDWGLRRSFGAFVEMDADLSHDPRDLGRILGELELYDVVVGSRYMTGGSIEGWSYLRRGISRAGNVYSKLVLSLPFSDLTGGFNGWNRRTLEQIDIYSIRSRGYAFQVELKWRAFQAGLKVQEIPICFRERHEGRSKMSSDIFWEAALRVLEMRFVKAPFSPTFRHESRA